MITTYQLVVGVTYFFYALKNNVGRSGEFFCALKILAVLASETSAIIKFKLAQSLC